MRYALTLTILGLAGAPAAAECLFSVFPNAGIPGHNDKTLRTSSAAECMAACTRESWCRSVDYERATGTCYVQGAGRNDAGMRFDYPGNPYDHYTCETRTHSLAPPVAAQCSWLPVPAAGIPGHNIEVLNNIDVGACQRACESRLWCRSIDYERGPRTCFLQDVNRYDVQLKYTYAGNPYDHFTCEGR